MSKTSDAQQPLFLALGIYREDRGGPMASKVAMACSVRNRVLRPGWWGHDYMSVLFKPDQYTSLTYLVAHPKGSNTCLADPNLVVWPSVSDPEWVDCMAVAEGITDGTLPDSVQGATHYFDKSLDDCPPEWAKLFQHTVDVGRFHFYKGW